jgi:hypothetical protein
MSPTSNIGPKMARKDNFIPQKYFVFLAKLQFSTKTAHFFRELHFLKKATRKNLFRPLFFGDVVCFSDAGTTLEMGGIFLFPGDS